MEAYVGSVGGISKPTSTFEIKENLHGNEHMFPGDISIQMRWENPPIVEFIGARVGGRIRGEMIL